MLHRTALVLTGVLAIAGCTPRLCDEHFNTSGHFTVRLLDIARDGGTYKYNPGLAAAYVESTGSCSGLDGMVANATLQLHATGTSSDPNKTCRRITATVDSLPSPTVLVADHPRPPTLMPISGDLYAGADVTVQGCAGQVFLQIFGASEKGPYSAPVPGEAPPAVFYRLFVPSAACLAICDDNFAAQLTAN